MVFHPNTTIADLVRKTESRGCVVTGLPEGIKSEDAAQKLKQINEPVYVRNWSDGPKFFSGWFPKEVVDSEGNVLFKIDYNEQWEPHISVEPSAHRYLI